MASDTLHVSNLPEGLDNGMVEQFFSIYGTVVGCNIPSGFQSGQTVAIVKFTSVQEARGIIATLHQTVPTGLVAPLHLEFHPRAVEPALSKASSSSFGKCAGGKAAQPDPWSSAAKGGAATVDPSAAEPSISDNVYVQGLPVGTTQDTAMSTFAEFGKVISIKLLEKGSQPCAALIRFDDKESARLVKEILHGAQPAGFPCPLKVRFANAAATPGAGASGAGKAVWPQDSWLPGKDGGLGSSKDPGHGKGAWNAQQSQLGGKGKPKGIACDALVALIRDSGCLPGGLQYRNDDAAVHVAGVPNDLDDHQLYRMFSPFGAIHSVFVNRSGHLAFGIVNYLDAECAGNSIVAYNGMQLPGGGCLTATLKSKGGW